MRRQQHRDAVVLERTDRLQQFRRSHADRGPRSARRGSRSDTSFIRISARPSRWRMPRENAPTRLMPTSPRPTRSSAAMIRLSRTARLDADQRRGVAQVVERRHVVVEADGVGHVADEALDLKRLARRIVAQHADGAGRDVGQAEHHQDRRGLAGAVRPEQTENLAATDRERDVVHGRRRAVALGQPPRLDDDIVHRRPNLATAPTMISNAIAMTRDADGAPHCRDANGDRGTGWRRFRRAQQR